MRDFAECEWPLIGEKRSSPLSPELLSAETVIVTALFVLESPRLFSPEKVTVDIDDQYSERTITALLAVIHLIPLRTADSSFISRR